MRMSEWQRPTNLPYPSVWRNFSGKERGGIKREYWVQDLTEEYIDEAIQLLVQGFVEDEPLCKFLDFKNDKDALAGLERLYRYMLSQKLGLVCLTNIDKRPKMIGFNCTGRSYKGQLGFECKNDKLRAFIDLEENYVPEYKQQYDILNISHYLYAIGLYVSPEYRGEGIGLQILNAREDLCRAVGLPASCTLFTSLTSQILAEKAGFKDLDPHKNTCINNQDELGKIVQSYRYMYKLYN